MFVPVLEIVFILTLKKKLYHLLIKKENMAFSVDGHNHKNHDLLQFPVILYLYTENICLNP